MICKSDVTNKKKFMYKIFHNIDGEKITKLNSDAEFVHFMRNIAVENEDEDLSITSVGEAKDYLNNYCDNLTLFTDKEVEEFLKKFGTEVRENEESSFVELMMDNHKCVQWGEKQFYIPEDATYSEDEERIYDVLNEAFHAQ